MNTGTAQKYTFFITVKGFGCSMVEEMAATEHLPADTP